MENFYRVSNDVDLKKILDTASDKLVILMYFIKNSSECRRALQSFEKAALNHTLTIFCIVDVDKFDSDSIYINNVKTTPSFESYYMGNSFSQYSTSNEREIETFIVTCEQQVMMQNNIRNGNGQNMNQGMNQNMNQNMNQGMNQMYGQQNQSINPMFLRQQILNNAQSNPMLYNHLINNPNILQQQVNVLMQQNMMQQRNNIPMQNNGLQMSSQMMSSGLMNPMNNMSNMPIIPTNIPTNMPNSVSQEIPNNDDTLPTLQQMKKWFHIFQMMQSCNMLNPSYKSDTIMSPTSPVNSVTSTSNVESDVSDEVVLPNGDKIVPLGNGKYGLIKKA